MENSFDLHLIVDILVPIIIAVVASSGFWLYIGKRVDRRSVQTELLIGLAHDRIVWLGMYYITRGSITQDEYENLSVYLFKPYEELGGNGTANRVMREVDKLPIQKTVPIRKGDKGDDVH